jgi:16S rRNA (guanine966-N2)-methyltransferase
MRVIAGSAGGIQLFVPTRGVRPTMDRVKAAIFSSLGDMIIGASVLDLFAGTGALGIEALSRGALSVLFVEQDRQAAAVIRKNLAITKLEASVHQQDVFGFLSQPNIVSQFNIVFADPPYEKAPSGERFTEKLLRLNSLPQLVEPNGILILEKHPAEDLPTTPHWKVLRRKTYGATEVLFIHHAQCDATGQWPGSAIRPARNASGKRCGQSSPQSEIQT